MGDSMARKRTLAIQRFTSLVVFEHVDLSKRYAKVFVCTSSK